MPPAATKSEKTFSTKVKVNVTIKVIDLGGIERASLVEYAC